MYLCTFVCMYVCKQCIYACMYVCMYACIYPHMSALAKPNSTMIWGWAPIRTYVGHHKGCRVRARSHITLQMRNVETLCLGHAHELEFRWKQNFCSLILKGPSKVANTAIHSYRGFFGIRVPLKLKQKHFCEKTISTSSKSVCHFPPRAK